MNLKITEEKENKLLSRKEITAEMTHEGPTPGYNAVKQAIANQLKADESLVAIQHIYPYFGEPKIRIIANIYESREKMEELEPESAEEEKKPAAEAKPSEEKKEEKPSEETKEKTPEKPAEGES
ncbi:30S ribosomal protein S24e [Candidatus Woesearchaeota archaeon]|nr:30S ribosomal protein S24e [Candidatus Woesearchaeota archaeon]